MLPLWVVPLSCCVLFDEQSRLCRVDRICLFHIVYYGIHRGACWCPPLSANQAKICPPPPPAPVRASPTPFYIFMRRVPLPRKQSKHKVILYFCLFWVAQGFPCGCWCATFTRARWTCWGRGRPSPRATSPTTAASSTPCLGWTRYVHTNPSNIGVGQRASSLWKVSGGSGGGKKHQQRSIGTRPLLLNIPGLPFGVIFSAWFVRVLAHVRARTLKCKVPTVGRLAFVLMCMLFVFP